MSLTHAVNFGTRYAFSKRRGSAFSEGPGLGPGPLYKKSALCRIESTNLETSLGLQSDDNLSFNIVTQKKFF